MSKQFLVTEMLITGYLFCKWQKENAPQQFIDMVGDKYKECCERLDDIGAYTH